MFIGQKNSHKQTVSSPKIGSVQPAVMEENRSESSGERNTNQSKSLMNLNWITCIPGSSDLTDRKSDNPPLKVIGLYGI